MPTLVCPRCSARLRVAESGVESVQCPNCENVIRVKNYLGKPSPPRQFELIDEAPPPPKRIVYTPPPPPSSRATQSSRLPRDDYEDDDEYEDDYERRPRSKGSNRRYARARLEGPATALSVCAIITVVLMTLSLGSSLVGLLFGGLANVPAGAAGIPLQVKIFVRFCLAIIGVVLNISIVFGAFQMKNLKSRSGATVTCIAALVPCIGPCGFLGIGFGIWGLIVLNDPRVRKAFH